MDPNSEQSREVQYNMTRMFAVVMCLAAPIMYLYVAKMLAASRTPKDNWVVLVVLLVVSLGELAASSLIPNLILRRSPNFRTQKAPLQQYWIIRMAMLESIFIFGLAYFFISGSFLSIFYFYAIGAVGVLMHWPTRERFDAVADQLEAK